MPDTTIKKVEAGTSPRGEMASGISSPASAFRGASGSKNQGVKLKAETTREYETVGYDLGQRKARFGRSDF